MPKKTQKRYAIVDEFIRKIKEESEKNFEEEHVTVNRIFRDYFSGKLSYKNAQQPQPASKDKRVSDKEEREKKHYQMRFDATAKKFCEGTFKGRADMENRVCYYPILERAPSEYQKNTGAELARYNILEERPIDFEEYVLEPNQGIRDARDRVRGEIEENLPDSEKNKRISEESVDKARKRFHGKK